MNIESWVSTEPSNDLKFRKEIEGPILDRFIEINKCFNNWVHVRFILNGNVIEGWIESERLCPNPYSTCS